MDQSAIVEGLRDERERLTSLLRSLPAEAWDRPSLCEGWTVKDVVSHLVGNVADVLEQRLDGIGSPEFNQRQVDERAGTASGRILDEWDERGPELERFYAALTPELWEAPMVFGTVGRGVQRQLEDLWVHAQDIRLALGEPPSQGPGVGATLEIVAGELPERCRALAPGVGAVAIDTDGFRHDAMVGSGADTIRIAGDPVALALAGTGRLSLDEAIADGRLKADGPVPVGFAEALNMYGPPVGA